MEAKTRLLLPSPVAVAAFESITIYCKSLKRLFD